MPNEISNPAGDGNAPEPAASKAASDYAATRQVEEPAQSAKKPLRSAISDGWAYLSKGWAYVAPIVGRKLRSLLPAGLALLIVAIFAGIVIASESIPDTASAACELIWKHDTAQAYRWGADVYPRDIYVGDQICIRVTAPAKGPEADAAIRARDPRETGRRWHLLLNHMDVNVTATGAVPTASRPLYLSYRVPPPLSTKDTSANLVAKLWTGGLWSADPGGRWVSLRLYADARGKLAPIRWVREHPVRLHIFNPVVEAAGGVLFVLLVGAVILLAARTTLLRDSADPNSPFSLARSQMAFWFIVTAACFCYVWLLTGVWKDVINGTTLTLLGISVTSGFAATAIAAPKATQASRNFLIDILSERMSDGTDGGVTVHRLIALTWTIVLGGVFVAYVFANERFPDFDVMLLSQLGITSGLYVGFKWLSS
jgi:hypothetical protein